MGPQSRPMTMQTPRSTATLLCFILAGLTPHSPAATNSGARSSSDETLQIAFASHRDGNWEIYLTDPDGRNQTRLTNRDAQDRFPLWSPDRSRIAFGSQVGGTHWELWVMNRDGTKPRPLATNIVAKSYREWSHDGTRIVFAGSVDGNREILSVEVESGRVVRLTSTPGEDRDPSWSPDDSDIVFASTRNGNSEIYLMRADGSQLRRLTTHPDDDGQPTWSPDGSRIAFISTRDGDRDVYSMHPDGSGLERLTVGAHATKDMPRWSPDGSHLAVQAADRDNYDIELVRVTDNTRTSVAASRAFDGQYSWSPDGQRLAFISARDGFDAMYVTDLTGEHLVRLTGTLSLNPEWSP